MSKSMWQRYQDAALEGDNPADYEEVIFQAPDFQCPRCKGFHVATEDDGTGSCDDCGAQGTTCDHPMVADMTGYPTGPAGKCDVYLVCEDCGAELGVERDADGVL